MKMQVVTTITSLIDVDTFATDHNVSITGDAIPESMARIVVAGACRATIENLEGKPSPVTVEDVARGLRELGMAQPLHEPLRTNVLDEWAAALHARWSITERKAE